MKYVVILVIIVQILASLMSLVESVKKGKEKETTPNLKEKSLHAQKEAYSRQNRHSSFEKKINPLFREIEQSLKQKKNRDSLLERGRETLSSLSSQLRQMEEKQEGLSLEKLAEETKINENVKEQLSTNCSATQVVTKEVVQEEQWELNFAQEDVITGILYSEILEKPLSLR